MLRSSVDRFRLKGGAIFLRRFGTVWHVSKAFSFCRVTCTVHAFSSISSSVLLSCPEAGVFWSAELANFSVSASVAL
jgi:hypothetical protein